jgi:hypothetical protein
MSLQAVCTNCGERYTLKDEVAGLRVKCMKCQGLFLAPEVGSPPPLPPDDREPNWERDTSFTTDDPDEPTAPWSEEARPRNKPYWNSPGKEDIDPIFDHDKFLLRQQHFSLHEKYAVFDEEGNKIMFLVRPSHIFKSLLAIFLGIGGMIVVMGAGIAAGFFLEQALGGADKGALMAVGLLLGLVLGVLTMILIIIWLVPKRHIFFYRDEAKEELLLEVHQDSKWMPVNATYTVVSAQGKPLGQFHKNYLYNFIRKRWYGYDAEGNLLLIAMEDSMIKSLLRRFLGPMMGLLRTNFIILKPNGHTLLGQFNRTFTILDRYVLDLANDRELYLDRRLAVALGVLLDTGERR